MVKKLISSFLLALLLFVGVGVVAPVQQSFSEQLAYTAQAETAQKYSEQVVPNKDNYSNIEIGGGAVTISITGVDETKDIYSDHVYVFDGTTMINVTPGPGYIITSVVVTASDVYATSTQTRLKFKSNPADLTYKGSGNTYTLTGFKVGQSYVIESDISSTIGKSFFKCTKITVTYEEHAHTEEDFTLTYDDTNHWEECVCKYVKNLAPHTWVEGETTQPGNGLPGVKIDTCQDCSAEKVEYTPCSINDEAITVESAGQLGYNGQYQVQKVIIKAGDVVLEEGVDYVLSNNVEMNVKSTYKLTITGMGKYSGTREFKFSIEKGRVPYPEVTEVTYNGLSQNCGLKTNTYYRVAGGTGTNAGKYQVTFTLTSTSLYQWEDGKTTQYKTYFVINPLVVQRPEPDPTVYYFTSIYMESGDYYSVQSQKYNVPSNSGYYLASTGEYNSSRAYPGEYKVEIALNNKSGATNYVWDDGTTKPLYYDFVIHKGKFDMTEVVFESKEIVYDGNEHSIEALNIPEGVKVSYTYQQNGQTISGIPSARGEYLVTAHFEPKDTANADYYEEIPDMTATLKITKGKVVAPTADTTEFIYNGQPQTYVLATNDLYTITGDCTQTNAGKYTITLSLNNPEDCEWDTTGNSEDLTYTFEIKRAIVSKPAIDETEFVYNGNEQTYTIAESDLYTVSGNKQTNAGSYKVVIALKDKENSQWDDETIEDLEYSFEIAKLTYDMTGIEFEGKTVTYDGNEYSLAIAGTLPQGVEVTYENNNQTNAGTYEVIAIFTGNENYNEIESKTATLTINKATYDMSGVVFADKEVVYDGNAQSIIVENLPQGVTVTYENNGKTDVGTYTITANFTGNANYNEIESKTATLTINKATYDMSGVVFADKEVVYDGNAQSIIVENLPQGVEVNYENNGKTDVGSYVITATFTGNANYNAIESKTATLTITKANIAKPVADSTQFIYNGQEQTYALAQNNLYTISNATQTNAGSYEVKVELKDKNNSQWADGSTEDLTYSFVIAKATYDMSGVVFANKTVVYDGNAQSIIAENLPQGVEVTYENNGKTNVGTYTITAIFTGNANYNAIANKTATLTITKANIAKPVADSTQFIYNGQAQTYTLATSDLYTISNTVETNAGSYEVKVALKDKNNYQWADGSTEDLTYSFVIAKATYDMSGVVFANKTVVYNGNAQSIIAENLPQGVEVAYENNGKTNAGVYTITAIFTGNANYNAIANKTATLTINKATYDMSSVVFANKTVVYDGNAHSIIAENLPTGVTVAYENNGKTNAGVYTITAIFTGNANYNAIANKTATLTIEKATYDMSGVVFANKTVVYNGNAQSIIAENLPQGVEVAYENNGKTNAGVYTITAIFTGNANYNAIANKTATLTINKATYDMSGVVFANKTVVYDGSAHSIIAENLPTGVTVSYENNGKTNAGVYTITAIFTGNANYNTIANKTATLTIKTASLTFDTDENNDIADDIIISAPEGIDPTTELRVEQVEEIVQSLDKNQKVGIAYDVKLLLDGAEVQPDGTLEFKILIPEQLRGKDFKILHIHNETEVSEITYTTNGDYVVFTTNSLSQFVFVYDMGSILWVAIVLVVLVLLEVAFLLFVSFKEKQLKTTCVTSAFPPFIFGMFIAEWEIILVIVLVVAFIALSIISIIKATKLLSKKVESETKAVEEKKEEIEQIEVVEEKEGRIAKTFTERLNSSPAEVVEYYNAIKNELLSYKKAKSKISTKHESFRVGKPFVAKLKIRGKSLCLFLALNPSDYKDTKYKVKDMSAVASNKELSTMYKINLPRRVEYAKDLISDVMKKYGIEKK